MNEEWFGICAKGPTNKKGLYTLYPRAAYYALKEAHQINPYSKGVTADLISKHFSEINLSEITSIRDTAKKLKYISNLK